MPRMRNSVLESLINKQGGMDRKNYIQKGHKTTTKTITKIRNKKKEEERRKQKQVNEVIYKTTMRGKTKIDKLATTEETKESL